MRYTHIGSLGLVMASLVLAGDAPRGGRIAWEKDLGRGLRDMSASDRPAMLYFTDDR